MQVASAYMTDGSTASTRHLGKQINYNMKFLVSKGKSRIKEIKQNLIKLDPEKGKL